MSMKCRDYDDDIEWDDDMGAGVRAVKLLTLAEAGKPPQKQRKSAPKRRTAVKKKGVRKAKRRAK